MKKLIYIFICFSCLMIFCLSVNGNIVYSNEHHNNFSNNSNNKITYSLSALHFQSPNSRMKSNVNDKVKIRGNKLNNIESYKLNSVKSYKVNSFKSNKSKKKRIENKKVKKFNDKKNNKNIIFCTTNKKQKIKHLAKIKKKNNQNKKLMQKEIKKLKREKRKKKMEYKRRLKRHQVQKNCLKKKQFKCKLINLNIDFINEKLRIGCSVKMEKYLRHRLIKLTLQKEINCDDI